MSISPVILTDVSAAASNADVKPVNKEAPQLKPQSTPGDTVQISDTAKAALQEATETPFQTAKEARSGDLQAKRLLAREAAAEEAKETPAAKTQEAQETSLLSKLGF